MDHNTLRSRQLNPCDHLFWKCRGYSERPHNWKNILKSWGHNFDQDELIRRRQDAENLKSLQNNPNNIQYWLSRGWSYRPDDWYERVYGEDNSDNDDDDDYSDEYDDYSDEDDDSDDEESDSEDFDDEDAEDEEYDEEYEYDQWLKSLQNNPNNIEYWRLRGYSYRPSNWRELASE